MKGCDHQVVYSGRTNLERKFEYICRVCGEHGWDSRYVLAQVDVDEFCRQRVLHGWTPLPRPGLTPMRVLPLKKRVRRGVWLALAFFAGGFVVPQLAIFLIGAATPLTWALLAASGAVLVLALAKLLARGQP